MLTKREKKEKILRVVEALKKIYPEALCSLNYEGDGYKLLIMGRLSAQCTDERVNIVCKDLFKKYPSAKSLADAELEDIEAIIKPCGLYKMKAKNIKEEARKLHYEYGGVVPSSMDKLLEFEGVGRKIANLLLGDLYGLPAIVSDTHCMRICGRLGMYKEGQKDPLKTEIIMSELLPPNEQSDFCHRMVLFGREFCTAKSPKCDTCPIKNICNDEITVKKLSSSYNSMALDLVWQVFSEFEVPVFPKEGAIEYKRIIEETREKNNITFYGAFDKKRLVGVLGMRQNNHIGYFYVDSSYHKRGIGKRLFNLMKGDYEKKIFTVNAAPYGIPIYTRLGFIPTDTQKNVNGVIFTPMKYEE